MFCAALSPEKEGSGLPIHGNHQRTGLKRTKFQNQAKSLILTQNYT